MANNKLRILLATFDLVYSKGFVYHRHSVFWVAKEFTDCWITRPPERPSLAFETPEEAIMYFFGGPVQ